MFWCLLFIVVILFIYIKLYQVNQYWKNKNVLHIKPWPLIGNTLPFLMGRLNFTRFIQKIYNTYDARYFGIQLFIQPSLLIKDTELVKQILVKDFNHFTDHQIFLGQTDEPLVKYTLMALEGQDWRDMRATLSPAFTGSKMRAIYILINRCANQFVEHFVEISKQGTPITLEIKKTCTKFAIDIILSCLFGVECNYLKDENNEFYKNLVDIVGFTKNARWLKFAGLFLCPKLLKFLKIKFFTKEETNFIRNFLHNTIAIREQNQIIRPDMIHLLMEARKGRLTNDEQTSRDHDDETYIMKGANELKQNKFKTIELTDDILASQVIIFSFAGVETTSTVSSFMLYELAVNQSAQRKLQKEIDEAFENFNEIITYEKLMKLKYLDMVINETLRKWPPLTLLDRVCTKPYTIQPVGNEKPLELKKGDIVHIPIYALHMDPKYYPDPERFDPERFSNENKPLIETLPYLPFGNGPRSCIGNRFGLVILKTFLVQLLKKFEIVPVEKSEIPLQLSNCNLVLNVQNGLWLGFKLRTK